MLTVKLTRNDIDEPLVLEVPERISEIKVRQKINFDVAYEDLSRYLIDISLSGDARNRTYYLYLISKCLSEFYEVPLIEFLGLDITRLLDKNGELLPGVLESHFDKLAHIEKVDFNFDNAENKLLTLFGQIFKLIRGYKPELRTQKNFTFMYKDFDEPSKEVIWIIPKHRKSAITGEPVFDKISTLQAVEILEIKRWADRQRKAILEAENDVDQQMGNIYLTEVLGTLALLATREGETLPTEFNEVDKWVDERMRHFLDISLDVAMDATFFLYNTMKT